MKSSIKYLPLIFLLGLFLGCNDPQPTALVENEDPMEIEVLTKNPAEPTSFGVDSIGINENPASFTNVVTVAGIKQSVEGNSFKTSFAQTVFFDRTRPVLVLNNRLIGYATLSPGRVFFDNEEAKIRPLKVRYGINKDTSLGVCYRLYKRNGLGDLFNFNFNSSINFKFTPFLSPSDSSAFDIATPPEIFLNYKFAGTRAGKNLNLILEWNAGYVKDFQIVLSVFDRLRNLDFPLYRIKTSDDGKFIVPKNLLTELGARFDRIILTLIRKYEKRQTGSISELIVVSQSINSITVDIP